MMKTDLSGFSRLELNRVDLDDGVVDMVQLKHSSDDDSPTINDGIGIVWQLQDGTANSKLLYEGAALDVVATDIGSASQDVDLNFYQRIAGVQTNTWSIDADGGFKINISPLVLTSADATTEFQINNTAVDGDPYLSWALSGIRQFSFGVDDGDSDKLKLGTTAIGTSTMLEFTSAGTLAKFLVPTEIENPAAGGAPALLIDNDDIDQIAIDIEAANTTADVINIAAANLTTGKALDVSGLDALTSGSALQLESNSASATSRTLASMQNLNVLATSTTVLTLRQDAPYRVMFITQNADGAAISIDTEATTSNVVDVSADQLTSGSILSCTDASALTTGKLFDFRNTLSGSSLTARVRGAGGAETIAEAAASQHGGLYWLSREETRVAGTTADDYDNLFIGRRSIMNGAGGTLTSTGAVVHVVNIATQTAGTLTDSTNVLHLYQAAISSGDSININHDGTGRAIYIDAENTTTNVMDISATLLTSGIAIDISDLDAIDTGKALHIDATGVTHTSGILMHVDSGSDVITGAGRLFLSDHTNTASVSGILNEFKTIAADESILLQLTADGLTSGSVLVGTFDGITTGIAVNLTSTSNVLAAGEILAINHAATAITAAKTGDGIDIDFNRTLAAGAQTDNYNALSLVRTSATSAAVTITAQGTVMYLENADTAGGGGTVTDSVDVLSIVQDALSTGQSIVIDHNGAGNAIEIASASDAATSTLGITNEAGGFGANISRNLAAAATDSALVYINDDGASDQAALHIHTDVASDAGGRALFIDADQITTQQAIELTADVLTSGIGANLTSSSTGLTTNGRILKVDATGDFDDAGGQVVEIASVHTTGTGLQLTMDAVTDGVGMYGTFDGLTVGEGVSLTHTTSVIADGGSLFRLSSTGVNTGGATNGTVLDISATAQAAGIVAKITSSGTTTGDVFDITATNQTSGNLMTLTGGGAGTLTGGSLARFDNSGATTGAILELINTTGVYTSTEGILNIDADALTTGTVVDVNAVGLTSGNGIIVTGGGANMISGGALIRLDMGAATAGSSLEITTSGVYTGTDGLIDISAAALTAGTAIDIGDLNGISTGKGLNIASSSVGLSSGELLQISRSASGTITAKTGDFTSISDVTTHTLDANLTLNYDVIDVARRHNRNTGGADANVSTNQGHVVYLKNFVTATTGTITDTVDVLGIFQDAAAGGHSIDIDHNPNSVAINIDAENTTTNVIDISAAILTQGKVIDLSDLDAITTGKALHIDATGITQTDGILAHIDSASTALSATGRLLLVDHTGNATAAQGAVAEVASAAADDTTILKVTASAALVAGIAHDISVAAMTTGTALDISNADALTTGFMANFTSNSADVSARNLVHIHNDNVLAVGAVPLNIVNDAASNILELVDTDPAALGVVVERHHDSASPAVDDVISRTNYDGEDSASNQTTYAQSDVIIAVPTSGAEIGRQIHRVADLDGSLAETHRQEVGDLKPVRGNAQSYEWIEDFDDEASGVQFEAGLVADFWTTAGTNYNANNVTYTAGPNGTVQAITAGSDDDSVTAMGVALWRIDQNPILEARFKVLDITNVWIAVGYVEGAFADKVAPDDDICVVGIDSDNGHGFGADQIVAVTNDDNAGAVYGDCGVTITADTYITIRVDLTDTEQPRIWVNNTGGQITAVNEVAAASITGTVQAGISVAPYFMVQSLSGAADTFTIDYIKTWQDRA